jgi:NAD(P)-dependent dehydrogenase (short-subunit alcohol dehydrogenase family)
VDNGKDFEGKIVLVTGAGKGAGRALAEAFAARGATVAANDISPMNVEAVVAQINASGGQAKAYLHDIAKKVAAQALINEISDDFGHIDILVNCANVEPQAPLLDMDEWDLHRVFEVNAIGTFIMIQSVGRVMRAQGGGIIINVVKLSPDVNRAAYDASRAAVAGLTQRAASELAPHNIHLHTVTVGLPQFDNMHLAYVNPLQAVIDLCGPQFARENGKIINAA